jgi:quinol monooxygenase YgiN
MVKTIFLHKVKDFNAWKKVFDSFYSTRQKYGEKSYSVGTVKGEPNNAYVINEWESVEKFNAFRNSPDLQNAMKDAGVLEVPKITILDVVQQEVQSNY